MAILFQTHLSSSNEPCQLSTPRIITASLSLILFVWRPMSLFMFFISVQCVCVCWQTPVAVKLRWLSLKQRLNEIWMCREWIRVMEWAKYYLHCVSAILSWGDRYSVLRKVKSTLQVQHIYQQADSTLLMAVMLTISGILDIVGKISNLRGGVDHEHDLIHTSPTTVPVCWLIWNTFTCS